MAGKKPKQIDYHRLSVTEYLRLLNGTEIGPTCSRGQVSRMRDTHGLRIGDMDGKLDLFKTGPVRWEQLKKVLGKPKFDKKRWEQERDRARRAAQSDIGEIPSVPKVITLDDGSQRCGATLRQECIDSLESYARTMYPDTVGLEWSPDHYELVADLEQCMRRGGKRAKAYQRGFGKTTWFKVAIEWGIVTGLCQFAFLIGKSEGEANKIRAGMQRRLETNKMLRQLFPEVGWVMWKLSKNTRGNHTYKGEVLKVQKIDDQFILPRVEGSPASEAVIGCSGIFGGYRGAHYDRADGKTVRPTHVLVDDPQDDVMARNPETVQKVIDAVQGAIEELSGPDHRMALFIACTCIQEGCAASRLTNPKEFETYMGVRQPAMDSFPTCLDPDNTMGFPEHWKIYDQLRKDDLARGDEELTTATDYYQRHHDEMNHGASVRWKARYEWPTIDALQFLMGKYLEKPEAFFAEYQQQPQDKTANVNYLNEDQLKLCFNGLEKGIVPSDVVHVTAAIDIQEHVLYWMRIGWAADMTGYILDFGTTPDQGPGRFAHTNVQRKIGPWVARQDNPDTPHTWETERQFALEACCDRMLEPMEQVDPAGGYKEITASNVFVDARWQKIEAICLRVAALAKFSGLVVPSGGQFVSPNRKSISRQNLKVGQQRPDRAVEWYTETVSVDAQKDGRFQSVKQLEFDANHYRTQVQKALAKNAVREGTSPGPGRISFHGTRPNAFLASHLAAKRVSLKEGNRRTCEVWDPKPNVDQDHWLDCLVMARIGAEYEGLRADAGAQKRPGTREAKPISQADIPFRR